MPSAALPLLALLVAGALFGALTWVGVGMVQEEPPSAGLPPPPSIPHPSRPVRERPQWLGEIASTQLPQQQYPARELEIGLELVRELREEELFRVIISEVDAYAFFCIHQVLSKNSIPYSYYRNEEFIQLVITTKDRGYLDSVLSELGEYGISYTVETTLQKG